MGLRSQGDRATLAGEMRIVFSCHGFRDEERDGDRK